MGYDPMDAVTIRSCAEDDMVAVQSLFSEFVQYHAEHELSFNKVPHHEAVFAGYVRENMAKDTARMLIAEFEGQVVGYCLCQIQEKPPVYEQPVYGYIDNIAVREGFQHLGIGTKLFESAKSWFQSKGISRIELFAAISNPKSTRFWRKIGFVPYTEQMYMEIL
jgi:ribosomal protein S18 acetylase RimI-like enzyme